MGLLVAAAVLVMILTPAVVVLALRRVTLAVQVVDARSGAPLRDVEVRGHVDRFSGVAIAESEAPPTETSVEVLGRTDATGRFERTFWWEPPRVLEVSRAAPWAHAVVQARTDGTFPRLPRRREHEFRVA